MRVAAMSLVGPSRLIAAPREFGRKRGIAEIDGQPSIAEDDARDPKRSFEILLLRKTRFAIGSASGRQIF
jgi:hypothetical protein